MAAVVMHPELLASLDTLTASWWLNRFIGLYQNDWTPQAYQGISAVEPATFSGYDGLRPLSGSLAAVLVGDQARSTYPEQIWAHDGGPVQCYVYGVYVVDSGGALCWADRVWSPPVPMFGAGQVVSYVPTPALQSIFPVG